MAYIFNMLYQKNPSSSSMVQQVNQLISTDELFRQTAEESSELAQAALKIIRVINGTTPVSKQEAVDRLIEEIADVQNCMDIIFERYPGSKQKATAISEQKMKRWKERLE